MKKYVYPKGIAGELLGQMVSYAYDCDVCFIDDSCIATSLERFKDELIENNESVFVAWDKRSTLNDNTAKILINKLEAYSIKYYDDSFFMISKMLADKLYNQIKSKKWDKEVVAIEVSGMANDKHIGFLDDYLIKNNVRIVYLCGTALAYNRVINKINANNLNNKVMVVCMPCYYLDLIDFVKCITKVSWTNKNENVPTICIGHSLSDFSNCNLDTYSKYFDYLCVSGKCYMPEKFSAGGGQVIPLCSGYLGFDGIVSRLYGDFVTYNLDIKDSVLFAPYNKDEFDLFLPLINTILPFYKVVLRSRLVCERGFWSFLDDIFSDEINNGSLIIDDSLEISDNTYLKCFVLVCGVTTSKFTFPLLSGSPSLVIGNFRINSNLGFILHNDCFLDKVHEVYNNKEEWCKKITRHREKEIYNFGHASEFLSNFILKTIF